MQCPPELVPILLGMIRMGILYTRSAAWSGDAERCALEADHIHNLPGLIEDFSDEGLSYYWKVERTLYLDRAGGAHRSVWEPYWAELRPYVERVAASDPA